MGNFVENKAKVCLQTNKDCNNVLGLIRVTVMCQSACGP